MFATSDGSLSPAATRRHEDLLITRAFVEVFRTIPVTSRRLTESQFMEAWGQIIGSPFPGGRQFGSILNRLERRYLARVFRAPGRALEFTLTLNCYLQVAEYEPPERRRQIREDAHLAAQWMLPEDRVPDTQDEEGASHDPQL